MYVQNYNLISQHTIETNLTYAKKGSEHYHFMCKTKLVILQLQNVYKIDYGIIVL